MTTQSLTFREDVRPADVQAVRDIILSTGFFRPDEVDVAVELVEENLAKGAETSGYHFIFAESEGETIGYACFGPIACTIGSYDLFWIAVHDKCRGKGAGKEILRRSEEAVARMKGRRLYIETSSQPKYEPTRAFYLRTDYVEEARLKEFYAPGDDKVIYVKAL